MTKPARPASSLLPSPRRRAIAAVTIPNSAPNTIVYQIQKKDCGTSPIATHHPSVLIWGYDGRAS